MWQLRIPAEYCILWPNPKYAKIKDKNKKPTCGLSVALLNFSPPAEWLMILIQLFR
jgi:hypothetical protein